MNAHTRIHTATPITVGATTCELIAIHDIAHTLAAVLTGLALAPRCSGPVDAWVQTLLEGLYAARGSAAAALLNRTDENQMRASVLAQSLEWAIEDEDSAALLRVVEDVASRPGAVAL
ncbi:hypothetical protein [Bradyrhizobium sp. 187]|uniref:hypothetical protein n=1 Tax=Bradyrhizobium sp. 187 TaxID=2782655 RepID=UPI001FFF7A10|nr:hypothetical protein [Bradyrhizobium sp. 187]UPJ69857.1 hypothetical protein IVB19_19140 [Bradyrhizobium sp. 187]